MTDLSVTAANCVPGAGAVIDKHSNAGETIAAGKAVYLDPTSKKWMLADSNSATVAARTAGGIAVCSASLNQPLSVLKSGPITLGATLTANTPYYLSDTPGGICPVADVGSGEYLCQIGIASTTALMNIDIQATGVAN